MRCLCPTIDVWVRVPSPAPKKETPYGEKASKKSIYSIDDNMFRFWYRFVPENASMIARGAADLVYKRIEPHLPEYMGKVFEEICKQHLFSPRAKCAGNAEGCGGFSYSAF